MNATAFFAKVGESDKGTSTHAVKDGKPICGMRPRIGMEIVWNAMGWLTPYIECKRCLRIVAKSKETQQ